MKVGSYRNRIECSLRTDIVKDPIHQYIMNILTASENECIKFDLPLLPKFNWVTIFLFCFQRTRSSPKSYQSGSVQARVTLFKTKTYSSCLVLVIVTTYFL